jgi:hypothetical protein
VRVQECRDKLTKEKDHSSLYSARDYSDLVAGKNTEIELPGEGPGGKSTNAKARELVDLPKARGINWNPKDSYIITQD